MTTTPLNELTSRQIQIELCQRAIENRAVAINAFEVGIKVLKEKQARGFRELARQTATEKAASDRHPNDPDQRPGEQPKS